jgi:hypothetical protein
MTTNPDTRIPDGDQIPSGQPIRHDRLAVWAFVTVWLVPLAGIIMGHLSNSRRKAAGMARDTLAVAAIVLGYVFSVIGALAILLVVALAGLSSSANAAFNPATPGGSVSSPAPASSSPAPAITQAPQTPASPAGPDKLQAGETELIGATASGASMGTVTVGKPVVTTWPADSYGEKPANGYYVAFKVTYKADKGYTDGWNVSSLDFHAVVGGQHFDEDNGHAYEALSDINQELSSSTLAAGETTTGMIVFDVPSPHGAIVYAPNFDGQPVAQWSY